MNKFDFGAMPVRGGFLGFYRMVHHSKNFILRDGRHDILFATAEEAEREAGKAFKEYLNSPISGMIASAHAAQTTADALFPNLQSTVIKQKGKTRRVEVERRAIA